MTNKAISVEKCRNGVRVAKCRHKLTWEENRPAYVVGMCDKVETKFYEDGYRVRFHEGEQTREQTQYLN